MNQGRLLRFALVGLPVGLALSIAAAVYLYYHPLGFKLPGRMSRRPEAESLLRKSPTDKDLVDYRRILTTELPDRSSGDPAALAAASNWLSSTLGPTNLGMPVRLQDLDLDRAGGRNVLVELPGRAPSSGAIVVCTAYDSAPGAFDSAGGTALLMTVANAFVGLVQDRPLVFAFVCRDEPPAGGRSGVAAAIAAVRAHMNVHGAIDMRVRPAPGGRRGAAVLRVWCADPAGPWASSVWPDLTARSPAPEMSLAGPADFDRHSPGAAVSQLGWWRQVPPPVPFVVLTLESDPDDIDALVAMARALEGALQALATR